MKKNFNRSPNLLLCKLGGFLFTLEVCKNHSRGLMGRSGIPSRGGMVFIYDRPDVRDFHMKNCLIPLDIVFCKNGRIEKIYHQCPPCQTDNCELYSHENSDCVIELPGGTCENLGINESLIYRFF